MAADLLHMTAVAGTTFLVLLFLRAAWHKLADFDRFSGFAADYQLLPGTWAEHAARLLIGLEGLTVVLLLIPQLNRLGALLAIALLLAYAVVIGINLARGHVHIDCGCGGTAQRLSPGLLLRNGLLVVLAMPIATGQVAPLGLFEATAAIIAGSLLWLIYNVAEQLLANSGHIHLALRQSGGMR